MGWGKERKRQAFRPSACLVELAEIDAFDLVTQSSQTPSQPIGDQARDDNVADDDEVAGKAGGVGAINGNDLGLGKRALGGKPASGKSARVDEVAAVAQDAHRGVEMKVALVNELDRPHRAARHEPEQAPQVTLTQPSGTRLHTSEDITARQAEQVPPVEPVTRRQHLDLVPPPLQPAPEQGRLEHTTWAVIRQHQRAPRRVTERPVRRKRQRTRSRQRLHELDHRPRLLENTNETAPLRERPATVNTLPKTHERVEQETGVEVLRSTNQKPRDRPYHNNSHTLRRDPQPNPTSPRPQATDTTSTALACDRHVKRGRVL